MSRHACDYAPNCYLRYPHMWFYGGWTLRRPDGTVVRIWKGKIREARP